MSLKELRTGVGVYWWLAKLKVEFLLYYIDDWLAANLYPFWGRGRTLPRDADAD